MSMVMDEQKMEERRRKRMEAKRRIQDLYEAVSQNFKGRGEQWLQMAEALEAYSAPAVWAVLNKSPFASMTSFEAITGMAREALYGEKIFESYRRMLEKNPDCMFSDYCRGIYRHKALDYVNELTVRKKLEENIDDQPIAGRDTEFPDSEPDAGERFIKCYVDAAVDSDANPFHIIFWCYSKILPVILMETNCTSADTWAWKRMQDQSMTELSDNFRKIFNSTMRVVRMAWSRQYCERLAEPYTNCHGEEVVLGQAVLTDEFTQSNAKNWVTRMNKRAIKRAVEKILLSRDEELMQLAMRYTQDKYSI